MTVGLALRFALIFAAGTTRALNDISFELDDKFMTLRVKKSAQSLFDGSCNNRFSILAQSANRQPKVVIA